MADHRMTIAKASFAAACLKPDVSKLTRDDLISFHTTFETTVTKCSPTNVQNCKNWLIVNIIPSSNRSSAFAKYLTSFSKYAIDDDLKKTNLKPVSQTRKRIHLLYILNDILHHIRHHNVDQTFRIHLSEGLQPYLVELFQYAAERQKRRTMKRLADLLTIWEQQEYFGKTLITQVRQAIANSEPANIKVDSLTSNVSTKELPYLMPATHGDPSIPYYDLPAANLMPHITPNAPIPMRSEQIRALRFIPGPAEASLVTALKDFLQDVSRIDDPFASLEDEGIVADMDELGQLSYQNEDDETVGDTYYGWSRAFCEKMKKRGVHKDNEHSDRSRSRSSTSSRGGIHNKRRRYASSSDRSRSRSRSSRRDRSASYSPNLDISQPGQSSHDRSSYSGRGSGRWPQNVPAAIPSHDFPRAHMAQLHFPLPPLPPGGSNVFPTPMPRPAGWNGPWPPPPPPPIHNTGWLPNMPFPPPPPPPF